VRLFRQAEFAEVVPVSARKKEGLDLLLDKVVGQLKEGQRYFPKNQVTDQPERFLVEGYFDGKSGSR
jgi:GTP-binding protein Era